MIRSWTTRRSSGHHPIRRLASAAMIAVLLVPVIAGAGMIADLATASGSRASVIPGVASAARPPVTATQPSPGSHSHGAPSIVLGVYPGGTPSGSPATDPLAKYTALAGHAPAIVMWYQDWVGSNGEAAFPLTAVERVAAAGAVPMITWDPSDGSASVNQPDLSLRRIAAGDWDSYLHAWAQAAAAWGRAATRNGLSAQEVLTVVRDPTVSVGIPIQGGAERPGATGGPGAAGCLGAVGAAIRSGTRGPSAAKGGTMGSATASSGAGGAGKAGSPGASAGIILLRPMPEMNGYWSPWSVGVNGNTAADYVAAWRHIVSIFGAAGATNVRFVWSPNISFGAEGQPWASTPFEAAYPGDAWVDWVGLDGYNWGSSAGDGHTWQSFAALFGPSYARLVALTKKPLMIAETASAEANASDAATGAGKAAWVADLATALPVLFPRVRALIWFDANKASQGEADWRVNSSVAALGAWRALVADPRFGGGTSGAIQHQRSLRSR